MLSFNIPNFSENDIPAGVARLNALQKQNLENRYYAPNIESEIKHRNALAEGQLIENKNMPEKNRLANAYQSLINKWYEPNIQSEIGSRNATAAHTRAETPFIPKKYEIQERNSLTNQRRLTNEQSNAFKAWVQTPEGQKIVANRPDIANGILTLMENQSAAIMGNNPMANMPTSNVPAPVTNNLTTSPAQIAQSQQAKENIAPIPTSRDDLIKDIQTGAKDAYERTNLPADTKKRLFAGERFKTVVPSVLQNFDQASVYFSPKGRAKLLADEAKAAKGARVPPELQAYRKFTQGLEQMKVSGAFLEGVPADQISRAAYAKVYDIDKFFNNPTDAMDSLKYGINLALMADKANMSSLSDLKGGNENDEVIKSLMEGNGNANAAPPNPNTVPPTDGGVIKVIRDEHGKLVRSNS